MRRDVCHLRKRTYQGISGFRFFSKTCTSKETTNTPLKLQISPKPSYVCYHTLDEELKLYAIITLRTYGFHNSS